MHPTTRQATTACTRTLRHAISAIRRPAGVPRMAAGLLLATAVSIGVALPARASQTQSEPQPQPHSKAQPQPAGSRAPATVVRAAMNSDLKIGDPIFTPAYISRNHGYMVWDTLFAADAQGEIKPQMVETYSTSEDGKTWTFKLREGLIFHDGAPVTPDDVIESLKRWAARDGMGGKLMGFVTEMKPVDGRTFTIALNAPTGLMLPALGKPSSTVPFIMPQRLARTPPGEQVKEYIGSGPFRFQADEWKPGDRAVYVKFDGYKPRKEPSSGLAGGKVVKVDRVEWRWIPDQQTAVNALLAGEIDYIEQPLHDMLPKLAEARDVALFDYTPLGNQYALRFNVLHKPFDDPRIREAVYYAFAQEDFLQATIGNPRFYKVCKAMFVCGTELASDAGMQGKLEGNVKRARELLKEAGYDGTPVVLLQSTDLQALSNLAPVAKDALERAGFKVDMQSSDWQTVVARRTRRDPTAAGGWNALLTSWAAADVLNPVSTSFLIATCDKATFGWPCDETLEKLRDDFARATDPALQKQIAARIQERAAGAYPTHVILGQWYQPIAHRRSLTGIPKAPVPVFWNIEIKR